MMSTPFYHSRITVQYWVVSMLCYAILLRQLQPAEKTYKYSRSTVYIIYDMQTKLAVAQILSLLIAKFLSVAEQFLCDKDNPWLMACMQCYYEPCNTKMKTEQVLTDTWPLLSI